MGSVPAPPPPVSNNPVTYDTIRLKKSVKESIRHANDSKAFLKLLERTQKGSALAKIHDFQKSIEKDLAGYVILLDELNGKVERTNKERKRDGELEHLGASNGEDYSFIEQINKVELSGNPLL